MTEPVFENADSAAQPSDTQAVVRVGRRPTRIPSQLIPSPRPLFDGQPGLSLHADANIDRAARVAGICAEQGLGSVFTSRNTMRLPAWKTRARELLDIHRNAGGDETSIAFDTGLYAGKNRLTGPARLDEEWINFQLTLGLPYAYTPSPYIASGDHAGLQSVLGQTRSLSKPIVAVLPLDLSWLKFSRQLDALVEQINRAAVPVALILQHAKDPLGVQAAVKGLVDLLTRVDPHVLLLRSDTSAVGAVALGASMGAVGTRSGHRHLFPITKGKGPGHDDRISMFVPYSMSYRRIDTVAAAMAIAPDEQGWFACDCTLCNGRTLEYVDTHERAYQHSAAALGDLAHNVLRNFQQAPVTWRERCKHAQFVCLDLDVRLEGGWTPPDFQGAWLVALPDHDA